jgi:hypothetical protein
LKREGIGLILVASVLLLVLAWLYQNLSFSSILTAYGLAAFFGSCGSLIYFKSRKEVEK